MKSRPRKKYHKALSIFDVYCGDKSARAVMHEYHFWRGFLKKRNYDLYKRMKRL